MYDKLKSIVPKSILIKLRPTLSILKFIIAKQIFYHSKDTPVWLGREMLESLQQKYTTSSSENNYAYDQQSLELRGKTRAEGILSLSGTESEKMNTFLEIGCGDGMTCYALQQMGKKAIGIDLLPYFDEKAVREGVKLMEMDAAHLEFEDESFDFIFSFNSFEHFSNPQLVLSEAVRVVRENGFIFLAFGPLYMSPWGLHTESVTVPYCQFLFSKELLSDYCKYNRLKSTDYIYVNGWSLKDYRNLWYDYRHQLEKIMYREVITDDSCLSFIIKYPSCFKSKTDYFDNLIVSGIEVLFKKNK